MSDTPRTDAIKIRCGFQAVPEPILKHAQELERENAALNHKLDEILTNKNYEGGVQFWINKHDEVLLREASLHAENAALRELAARMATEMREIDHEFASLQDYDEARKEAQP